MKQRKLEEQLDIELQAGEYLNLKEGTWYIYLQLENYLKKDKEIERLNNIINELEKWLDKEINQLKLEDDYENADTLEIVQEKLQELKGSDKE